MYALCMVLLVLAWGCGSTYKEPPVERTNPRGVPVGIYGVPEAVPECAHLVPHELRSEVIKLDPQLLTTGWDSFRVVIFGDTLDLVRENRSVWLLQNASFTGRVVGDPHSYWLMVNLAGEIHAEISYRGQLFRGYPCHDKYVISEVSYVMDPEREDDIYELPVDSYGGICYGHVETGVIDVLVLHSAAAEADLGGREALRAETMMAVAITNEAFRRSELPYQLRIAFDKIFLPNWDLPTQGRELLDVVSHDTVVQTLRNVHAADVVFFVHPIEDVYGIAQMMQSLSVPNSEEAYAVVHPRHMFQSLTLAHEMGHLLGLTHDYGFAGPPPVTPSGYPVVFTEDSTQYRSVMSRNAEAKRIPLFSHLDPGPGQVYRDSTGEIEHEEDAVSVIQRSFSLVSSYRCRNSALQDVWFKRHAEDRGEEPSLVAYDALTNPADIWNRRERDAGLLFWGAYQMPQPGGSNYLYVKFRNDREVPQRGVLKAYVAPATIDVVWPTGWMLFFCSDSLYLLPHRDHLEEIRWTPPESFASYSILVRWISAGDTMAHRESLSTMQNVKNNNNIAIKNLQIVDLFPESQYSDLQYGRSGQNSVDRNAEQQCSDSGCISPAVIPVRFQPKTGTQIRVRLQRAYETGQTFLEDGGRLYYAMKKAMPASGEKCASPPCSTKEKRKDDAAKVTNGGTYRVPESLRKESQVVFELELVPPNQWQSAVYPLQIDEINDADEIVGTYTVEIRTHEPVADTNPPND
ncbi:MAG: zinc-dependent metalloprotease family protein [Bacteroidota bacterium]